MAAKLSVEEIVMELKKKRRSLKEQIQDQIKASQTFINSDFLLDRVISIKLLNMQYNTITGVIMDFMENGYGTKPLEDK